MDASANGKGAYTDFFLFLRLCSHTHTHARSLTHKMCVCMFVCVCNAKMHVCVDVRVHFVCTRQGLSTCNFCSFFFV
jgi:hypothetical protein